MSARYSDDIIDEVITQIKAQPEFWNVDPVERAKPDYTGLRAIRNNDVSDDYTPADFPILFITPEEGSVTELNTGCAITSQFITFKVSSLHFSGDTNIAKSRKFSEKMLRDIIDRFSITGFDKIRYVPDVLGGSLKTHNAFISVEMC